MKRASVFGAGVLAGAVLVGAIGYAAGSVTVQLTPEPVRLVIDGQEVRGDPPGQFDNGAGLVPLAFIHRGTTYVPVRLIGETLGRTVTWDPATRTVTLSPKGQDGDEPPAEGGKPIPFEAVSPGQAPEEVRQWVEDSRDVEAGQIYTTGGRTYILVTRGEKPTGGYGVRITSVTDEGEEVVVKVRYTNPQPGQMVPQVITYPYALVSTAPLQKPVRFEEASGAYVPKLVGLDRMRPAVAGSANIRLFAPEVEGHDLVVDGVARVFEGALGYEATGETGRILVNGNAQAQAGGGDWGHFRVKLPVSSLEPAGTNLSVFGFSGEDGSRHDVVSVDLASYLRGESES